MEEFSKELEVELDAGELIRADRYLAQKDIIVRSRIDKIDLEIYLIKEESKKKIKPSFKVSQGDKLALFWREAPPPSIEPEEVEFPILFENENVMVVDKPQGMVVHPALGNYHQTLAQGVMYRLEQQGKEAFSDKFKERVGIVHRLDKETSGVIITAKSEDSLAFLASQFEKREVEKEYLAIVKGAPPMEEDIIDGNIGRDKKDRKKMAVVSEYEGKKARTYYRVLKKGEVYSYLLLKPVTGRTHQIRVHLKKIGCPIVGDPLYGKKDKTHSNATLMLHAWKLHITLPKERKKSRFIAPLPVRFSLFLKNL